MLALATLIYEHPLIVALGPELSAYLAGFAVPSLTGEPHITPLGELYLEQHHGTVSASRSQDD